MTGEPVEAIYAALEASRHIGECAEHPEHLMDAENKARAAYPALDALVAQRDEARRDWQMYQHEVANETARAEAAEARVAELERERDERGWEGNVSAALDATLARAEAAEARVAALTEALQTIAGGDVNYAYVAGAIRQFAREALAAAAGEPEAATPWVTAWRAAGASGGNQP